MTKKAEIINKLNELAPVSLNRKRIKKEPFSFVTVKEESIHNLLKQEEQYKFVLELGATYWTQETSDFHRIEEHIGLKHGVADFIYRDIKAELYHLLPVLYDIHDTRSQELVEKVHNIINMMRL